MDIYITFSSGQTTKKGKPRNLFLDPFHNQSTLDEILLSLTGISAPTSIEILDRDFWFPVFHRRAHIFLPLSMGERMEEQK